MNTVQSNRNIAQSDMIYDYIVKHGSITPKEALSEFGCMRLGARIWELKHDRGVDIVTKQETAKNKYGKKVHYARYALRDKSES